MKKQEAKQSQQQQEEDEKEEEVMMIWNRRKRDRSSASLSSFNKGISPLAKNMHNKAKLALTSFSYHGYSGRHGTLNKPKQGPLMAQSSGSRW